MKRRFVQCDVFSRTPARGNGLAVVVEAQGLSAEAMQNFAAWTNLAEPTESWVRVESSVVLKGVVPNADVTLAEIRADLLAYLRTLSLAQIEGASGLQHLREDLNERVARRSKGTIRELIVESLVVQ